MECMCAIPLCLSDFLLNLNDIMPVLMYYYINTNADSNWAHHLGL